MTLLAIAHPFIKAFKPEGTHVTEYMTTRARPSHGWLTFGAVDHDAIMNRAGPTNNTNTPKTERDGALQGKQTTFTYISERSNAEGKQGPRLSWGTGWGGGELMIHLVRVICRLCSTTGWKLRILGYRSMGLRVPDVMITLWNLANTGFTAKLASKQLSYRSHHCIGDLRPRGLLGMHNARN